MSLRDGSLPHSRSQRRRTIWLIHRWCETILNSLVALFNMSVPSIFYLHGFASSPQSSKAQYLHEHLQAMGQRLEFAQRVRGSECVEAGLERADRIQRRKRGTGVEHIVHAGQMPECEQGRIHHALAATKIAIANVPTACVAEGEPVRM